MGGRGNGAARNAGSAGTSKSNEASLTADQKDFLAKLDSAKTDDIISIGGIDYKALERAANNGEEWAEDAMEQELPGVYIKDENGNWNAASYASEGTTFTRDEMIDIIRNSDVLGPKYKGKRATKAYFKRNFE